MFFSQYVFFRRFACNHQLIFDYSQTMTSLADIKGKFYNLGGDENGETGQECHGINERSLRRDHHFPGCDQQWHHQAHRERQVEIACWIKAYLDKREKG